MPRHLILILLARNECSLRLGLVLALLLAPIGLAFSADLLPAAQNPPVEAANRSDAQREPFPGGRFVLKRGDVVAFVGGADIEAAQHTGHLEALLAAKYRGLDVRFRNFGWEGDTVHAQPRDFGFPPLKVHLQRAGVSVIVLQFGRSEALGGRNGLSVFVSDYQKFLDECARQTPR